MSTTTNRSQIFDELLDSYQEYLLSLGIYSENRCKRMAVIFAVKNTNKEFIRRTNESIVIDLSPEDIDNIVQELLKKEKNENF